MAGNPKIFHTSVLIFAYIAFALPMPIRQASNRAASIFPEGQSTNSNPVISTSESGIRARKSRTIAPKNQAQISDNKAVGSLIQKAPRDLNSKGPIFGVSGLPFVEKMPIFAMNPGQAQVNEDEETEWWWV